ncbi:hypothetical protein SETIT_1G011200v2 [Setaria italica]|uniref:Uncharacterized protein n=1 Tax=Setaria italica TaxID=4555 RepID=A0A368PFL1_SETIT|nr:hypothetical protein SETIT_1G011200v2 [Setaria italica]
MQPTSKLACILSSKRVQRCRGWEERELVADGRGRRREPAQRGHRLPRVGAARLRLCPRVMDAAHSYPAGEIQYADRSRRRQRDKEMNN